MTGGSTQPRSIILDNEAVQALGAVSHPKHKRALAILEVVVGRNLKRSGTVMLFVPTSVRVEAGWTRSTPGAALINHIQIADAPLDGKAADQAADILNALGVSVADAHIGAELKRLPGPHTIVTSDAHDMKRISQHLGLTVTIAPL